MIFTCSLNSLYGMLFSSLQLLMAPNPAVLPGTCTSKPLMHVLPGMQRWASLSNRAALQGGGGSTRKDTHVSCPTLQTVYSTQTQTLTLNPPLQTAYGTQT